MQLLTWKTFVKKLFEKYVHKKFSNQLALVQECRSHRQIIEACKKVMKRLQFKIENIYQTFFDKLTYYQI